MNSAIRKKTSTQSKKKIFLFPTIYLKDKKNFSFYKLVSSYAMNNHAAKLIKADLNRYKLENEHLRRKVSCESEIFPFSFLRIILDLLLAFIYMNIYVK